ncbi:MAG TPA: hypothetical protein VHF67_13345 [Gaiellaceae bacterium]|nr:hypothetical protein [Gaiellaceae bacterium]
MFAAWGAILRTRALSLWLGWAALPIAIAAVAPPTLIPLIGTGVWIAVASVVMYRRDREAHQSRPLNQAVPAKRA